MDFRRFACILAGVALAALLVPSAPAAAAEDVEAEYEAGNWGTEIRLGINLLQSYYTKNWNGGDKGSIVWKSTLDALAKKKLGDDFAWTNTLNLAFGQNHQQDREADGDLVWRRPDKTTDEIYFESLLRYLETELDPYLSVRFESQFIDQTDPRRDFALNPLEFYESVGFSRTLVEDDERTWLARLGFTLHQSVRDVYLGDDEVASETTNDGGLELVFDYRSRYFDDAVDYVAELRFYQPLFYSGKSDIEDWVDTLSDDDLATLDRIDADLGDYTTSLDIDFKNTFTAAITDVINVQLMLRWVYDKYDNTVPVVLSDQAGLTPVERLENLEAVQNAVRKKTQFKQTMSIGLAYAF